MEQRNMKLDELKEQIEMALHGHDPQMSVPIGITQDAIYHCIRRIMRENPDIFWFSHQWKYTENDQTIRFHYTISKERSITAKNQIEDVIQNDFQISNVFHLSTPEQIMYVYKWIALYCKYNIYSAYNQTIYSVFVCRNSVCTGYAKAAQYLFRILGIESRLVFGTMHNAEKGSRHCWLMIKVNNLWYHFDPTFAVPEISDLLIAAGVEPIFGEEGLVYNYFCCDTDSIKGSRIIEDESLLPICTSKIDFKSLQKTPIHLHRTEGAEQQGAKGCLLSADGSFSNVYLWHSHKNIQSVVKIYKNDTSHAHLLHELSIMRQVAASNNVLHVLGVTEKQDGLIIEQATPLADLLCSNYYQLSAVHFCKLLLDVLNGLQDCMRYDVYYRDIHLNNIYRTFEGRYVLGDFGSCIWIDENKSSNPTGVGSPWYLAPETYLNKVFNEESATYRIGMLAYFLLNDLFPPLWNEYGDSSLDHRMQGEVLPPPVLLKKPSCAFEQLLASVIMKSLSFEPLNRYQRLSDLEKTIKQCLSLVKTDDYLLIKGEATCGNKIKRKESLLVQKRHTELLMSTLSKKTTRCLQCGYPLREGMDKCPNCNSRVEKRSSSCYKEYGKTGGNVYRYTINPYMLVDDFEEDHLDINNHTGTSGNHIPISSAPPHSSTHPDSYPSVGNTNEECSYNRRRIYNHVTTVDDPITVSRNAHKTYLPSVEITHGNEKLSKISILSKIFGGKKREVIEDEIYSSLFAPYEVKPKTHLIVQVYLHLYEEAEKVKILAQESDKNAERRDYIPLQCKLKKGDKVDVLLYIYGEALLMSDKKSVVWQGSFTKCSFDYFVPNDIDVDELSCVALLSVNEIPVGEMRFITKIVESPRKLNPEVIAHKYSKVFISYSHQDESKVKFLHEGLELGYVPHFFDRKYLKTGDVFPQVIQDYIDSADLFILCWSENASKSEYVEKERLQALKRAFPQVQPEKAAKLRIHPMSIEPHAELPSDMKENYHFGEI